MPIPSCLITREEQSRTGRYVWRGPGVATVVVTCGLLLHAMPAAAKHFRCSAGDTECLTAAITEANGNGHPTNWIRLSGGTYTLTDVNSGTAFGSNGLPVVTSKLAITGSGANATVLVRPQNAPVFRILEVAPGGELTLQALTIQGGLGNQRPGNIGAGVLNRGTVSIHDCILTRNAAVGEGFGGGLFNAGTARILSSTFTSNLSQFGGGIENRGTLWVAGSTFADNFGEFGGGGLGNRGTATILLSTFASNSVDEGRGGAVFNTGTITIQQSSLVNNRTDMGGEGGGIRNDGVARLENTILARNVWDFLAPVPADCSGSITSLGHNLIGDLSNCTVVLLPSDLTGEPGLGTFTTDGTPGHGHVPLLATSPAIDSGYDDRCFRKDQLGRRRIDISDVGTSICDIGAVEFWPPRHKGKH